MDQNNPQSASQPLNPPREKVIQPLSTTESLTGGSGSGPASFNSPIIDTQTTYPEATANVQNPLNTDQAFAMATMSATTKESNRLVCLRVKPLIIIGVLLVLSSIYTITNGSGNSFLIILGFVQLAMSIPLLASKDHHTVSLLLKIFLTLQLINLFFSFGNQALFFGNGLVTFFLCYVYFRVKSLNYY